MLRRHQWRRIVLYCLVAISWLLMLWSWLGHLSLVGNVGSPRVDALVANMVETTATVGGITLALIFLTAQMTFGAIRQTLIGELYRSGEVYILALYMMISVILGYSILANFPASLEIWNFSAAQTLEITGNLVDTLLIIAVSSVLLVAPTLALQVENLDPLALADKIADRISAAAIESYGLTNVVSDARQPSGYKFELVKVGLRPRGVDPLRPIHELLMEAVRARDRVLFGKLLRHLLKRVAAVHGAPWDLSGQALPVRARPLPLMRKGARRLSNSGRLHVTLTIVHYCVKRARNFVNEWQDSQGRPLDIGRHGILTGLGDIVLALAPVPGARGSIRICLYGALHISRVYSNVAPFGRIEPLNIFFEAACRLESAAKRAESDLCAEMLAWCSARTAQIAGERALGFAELLPARVLEHFEKSLAFSVADKHWLPGDRSEDPWEKN